MSKSMWNLVKAVRLDTEPSNISKDWALSQVLLCFVWACFHFDHYFGMYTLQHVQFFNYIVLAVCESRSAAAWFCLALIMEACFMILSYIVKLDWTLVWSNQTTRYEKYTRQNFGPTKRVSVLIEISSLLAVWTFFWVIMGMLSKEKNPKFFFPFLFFVLFFS